MKTAKRFLKLAAVVAASLSLSACDNVSVYGSVGYSSYSGYGGYYGRPGYGSSVSIGGRLY